MNSWGEVGMVWKAQPLQNRYVSNGLLFHENEAPKLSAFVV